MADKNLTCLLIGLTIIFEVAINALLIEELVLELWHL